MTRNHIYSQAQWDYDHEDREPLTLTEGVLLAGIWLGSGICSLIIVHQIYTFCSGLLTQIEQTIALP